MRSQEAQRTNTAGKAACRPRHARVRLRRGSTPQAAIGVVTLLAGLVLTAWVAWQLLGTTHVASAAAHDEIAAFYNAIEPPGAGTARLRSDLTAEPPPATPVPANGTWGTLIVPSWAGKAGAYGEDLSTRIPIAEGTSDAILNRAWAGHFPATATPGALGNFALAGHRRSYGQNFSRVDELQPGDVLIVETADAWFVYDVTGRPETVAPDAVDEVSPAPHQASTTPPRRLITLTTCTSTTLGEWGNDHRLAVHGELRGWAPRAEGIPPELQPTTNPTS